MASAPTAISPGDETELFCRHHDDLLRAVTRRVDASDALIEDACSFAWAQLLRYQPDRGPQLFGWLLTTAIREAYRLSRIERRDAHLEDSGLPVKGGSPHKEWTDVVADPHRLEDVIEARRALAVLAALPELGRRYLALFAAGYSYDEIAALVGGRSWNHVNKHIVKTRSRIRRIENISG